MTNKIVRGTMLLTGATFLSKFLGMIYVIPFNEVVGERGGALFQYAYNPYNILISLSTIGIPSAVSKFVSKYNSLGDYKTGLRMLKAGFKLMIITGILAFLALFFGSEFLAQQIITSDELGNSVEDVKMVMRMVSFALLIIPGMSIVRGFFQGYESMGPTAVSQVIEQIVRIVFLLSSVFIIVKMLDGTIATAVGFATFSAFVGGIASCIILWMYWQKRKPYIHRQINGQVVPESQMSTSALFKELFQYAGPFVLVGIAIPLYQLVDQFTFHRAMIAIGLESVSELAFSTINFYGHKLIIIPVTIATGLSLAIMPAITSAYTKNNRPLVYKQINQAIQIILLLVIPAVVGLIILSDVAYGSLFGLNNIEVTSSLLAWYAPVSLLFALFTVSSAILQGINEQRFAVVSLSAGFFIKLLLNIQLIHMFGPKGAIFGTGLAAGTAITLNLWRIHQTYDFSYRQSFKRMQLILILTALMTVAVLILKYLMGLIFSYETNRLHAFMTLIICVIGGGSIYLWLAYKSTLMERILGGRIHLLDKIFQKRRG